VVGDRQQTRRPDPEPVLLHGFEHLGMEILDGLAVVVLPAAGHTEDARPGPEPAVGDLRIQPAQERRQREPDAALGSVELVSRRRCGQRPLGWCRHAALDLVRSRGQLVVGTLPEQAAEVLGDGAAHPEQVAEPPGRHRRPEL
jgi:hypothetical protein